MAFVFGAIANLLGGVQQQNPAPAPVEEVQQAAEADNGNTRDLQITPEEAGAGPRGGTQVSLARKNEFLDIMNGATSTLPITHFDAETGEELTVVRDSDWYLS
jgi:hypothetical protein